APAFPLPTSHPPRPARSSQPRFTLPLWTGRFPDGADATGLLRGLVRPTPRAGHGPGHGPQKYLSVERLEQKGDRPGRQGFPSRRLVLVAGDEDDRDLPPFFEERPVDFQAAQPRQ